MGEIIQLSKKQPEEVCNNKSMPKITLMKNSSITAGLQILPEDIYTILRILINERKEVEESYKEAYALRDEVEMNYSKMILEIIENLISKFKSIESMDVILDKITFIELDCLVGVMEEFLQKKYLLDLQLMDDDTPLVTKEVETLYKRFLPIYEEKRKEFDNSEQDSNKK